MTRGSKAYQLQFTPILLKQLTVDCGISQGALSEATGASRPTINLCLNRGYIPSTMTGFTTQIEQLVRQHPRAALWLAERGQTVADIWKQIAAGEKLTMDHRIAIRMASTNAIHKAREAVDFAYNAAGATAIFENQLEMDAQGYLVPMDPGRSLTDVEGVFVGGDVHDHAYRQAVTAAGAGCRAAMDAERFLERVGEVPQTIVGAGSR